MIQRFILYPGDCLEVLDTLDENSIDAVVTDPPYELGFMGKKWDSSGVAFRTETWAKVLRVLKPGGHLVAFGGTRTYHRMACAIEDAGFEIREMHAWVFGSGFPKSLNVASAIHDAAIGQPQGGTKPASKNHGKFKGGSGLGAGPGQFMAEAGGRNERDLVASAKRWQGWGTATKPAMEPVCLARKPLSEKTVAANVLRWGTGALNIDATRIETDAPRPARSNEKSASGLSGVGGAVTYGRYAVRGSVAVGETTQGRWPANFYHDGSDEVLALFPQSKGQQGDVRGTEKSRTGGENTVCYGEYGRVAFSKRSDSGSAARFFYQAKASAKDRAGSKHPTVKPVALMRWLVRLVTPPGGTVLDPFAGTGTTGQAAIEEGFNAILIEREEEYRADILRRMNAVLAECDPDYPF